MEHEEKITAYLTGEMTKGEQDAFEKLLEKDPVLQAEVKAYHEVEAFLGQREWPTGGSFLEKDSYAQALQRLQDRGVPDAIKQVISNQHKKPLLRWNLVAASFVAALIGIAFYLYWPEPTSEQLYLTYYDVLDLPSLTERNSANSNNRLQELHKAGDYQAILDHTDTLTVVGSSTLYRGTALLELGQTAEAIAVFQTFTEAPLLDAPKGFWYLGLINLKNNQPEQAILMFEKLLSSGTNFKQKEAREILRSLD